MILYLISLFAFATVVFFILAFSIVPQSEESAATQDFLKRRLVVAGAKKQGKESLAAARQLREEEQLKKSLARRLLEPVFGLMAKGVELISPKAIRDHTKRWLEMSGWYNISIDWFLSFKGLGALVCFILALLILTATGASFLRILGVGLVSLVGGFYLPELLIRNQINKRQEAVLRAMPYTLDLLKVSVEAGLGLDEAILKVVQKTTGPLADEFNRCLYELQLGKQRSEALKDMSQRVSLAELSSFVTILVQAEKMGVSIGQILEIQSEQIRIRHHQKLQEKALRTPTVMLIPLILFIFPTIFIIVLGPAIIQLLTSLRSVF